MEFSDKNILLIKNGNHSFISIDGNIAKTDGEPIMHTRKRKIYKQGKNILEKAYETLKTGKNIVYYNSISGFWSSYKGAIT